MIQGTFLYGPQWGTLRFKYDPAVISVVKQIPGAKWDKTKKVWRLPTHAKPVMERLLRPPVMQLSCIAEQWSPPAAVFPEKILKVLRPYQVHGACALATYPGFILSFDLRTGKTITALGALSGLMMSNVIDAGIVLYPSSVEGEWLKQALQWADLDLLALEGIKAFDQNAVDALRMRPYLLLGCSYELVGRRYKDILRVMEGRRFAATYDEAQNAKNRKASRYEAVAAISRAPGCMYRWATTGTSMRNRPADMWAIFDMVQPDSMGTFHKFCERYAAAFQGDYGWVYTGSSNEEELSERFKMISFTVTRADAGVYLPPSERKTILCNMSKEVAAAYSAQEKAHAPEIKRALMSADPSSASIGVLKKLAAATSGAKIPTAIERIRHHCEERGVKALVFATFHESLKALWDVLEPDTGEPPLEVPVFCAGGWKLPDARRKVIEQWKKTPGPGVLLANALSSGIGIDLSDADVCIFMELCWVPADFVQAEGRIQDIHQGKRTSPPLYEYLLCKGTVDADMGLALINKQNVINAVVGRDRESSAMTQALRESGAVDESNLALDREDPDAVDRALALLQARLLGTEEGDSSAVEKSRLAGALEDAFTEPEAFEGPPDFDGSGPANFDS